MAWSSTRIPRVLLLTLAIAGLALVSPQVLARGPHLCLWQQLFHLSSCPACGSTRALAAFFHGHWAQALDYNRNVVVTAPLLLAMLVDDLRGFLRACAPRPRPF